MPTKEALARAKKDKREGKSASTQAGEFVREEMDEIREGKHGARNPKQAIAIGLSEARRAGVNVPPLPRRSKSAQKKTSPHHKVSAKRSRATTNALKREPTSSASHAALSRQTKQAAAHRSSRSRHEAAMKAARTRARHQHQTHHAHH